MRSVSVSSGIATRRRELHGRVAEAIARTESSEPPDPEDWRRLGLEVFAFQLDAIEAYGRWCATRSITASAVDTLDRIPAVATEAFKHLQLFAGDPADAVRTFRTSGTSLGERRGSACFTSNGLSLMDLAIDVRARKMLFPDGRSTRILALAPSPADDPERIMAYGVARLIGEFGQRGSSFLVGAAGFDSGRCIDMLDDAVLEGVPVTLAGATSLFAALIDALEARGRPTPLPPGSRAMHAGGAKRWNAPAEPGLLGERALRWLCLPRERCINLLGMTELASQLYDDRLAASFEGRAARRGKVPAPWARTWVVDPESGVPLSAGQVGVLRHLDLASVERPLCIQTDDLGVSFEDGSFEILGRATGAAPRGCALDLEVWRGRNDS